MTDSIIAVPDALKRKMEAEASAEPKLKDRELTDGEWEAQLPKPSGFRLLIALPDVEEYIVVDMGADAYSGTDRFPEGPWCKQGDYVMFRMNTGTRFKVNGKEFRLMNDDSVEAVIPDPSGIMAI